MGYVRNWQRFKAETERDLGASDVPVGELAAMRGVHVAYCDAILLGRRG